MTPLTVSTPKAGSAVLAILATMALTFGTLLAFAAPASAQDEPATATIGGGECTGDNVEVRVMSSGGEPMVTENVAPDDDGNWTAPLVIPAVDEPVIASATCFDGDVAVVEYSPISLRVQPGVAVGGVIMLPAQPIEGAAAADGAADMPETLPETGPFTVPITALALALVAAGAGMTFVARQSSEDAATVATDDSAWPTSHWD